MVENANQLRISVASDHTMRKPRVIKKKKRRKKDEIDHGGGEAYEGGGDREKMSSNSNSLSTKLAKGFTKLVQNEGG